VGGGDYQKNDKRAFDKRLGNLSSWRRINSNLHIWGCTYKLQGDPKLLSYVTIEGIVCCSAYESNTSESKAVRGFKVPLNIQIRKRSILSKKVYFGGKSWKKVV